MSTSNSTTYIAAVVEYPPIYITNNIELTLKTNSDAYVKHIETASKQNADIIVFPEVGLTTVHFPEREEMQNWTTIIPSIEDNYTSCIQDTIEVSETLKKISCAARQNEIYVVINIAEKLPCTEDPCPKDKVFYYNTNVVFDRTGKIIARYRKANLFLEPQFNVTAIPEVVTFDTDFGVKFGTFICFDILFYKPALQLTRAYEVTDIVFPTAWFSEAPFLTAVQTQAGWSFAENVNLLASGYNRPAFGNTGSGIYLGRKGVGKAILPFTKHEEMLIYEVPKIRKRSKSNHIDHHHDHSKDHDEETMFHSEKHVHDELRKRRESNTRANNDNDKLYLLYDKIKTFETFPLETNVTKTVCQNNFCCEFRIEIVAIDPSTKYRLVVFNGIRLYGIVEAGVRACGVVQCLNDSISSCGSTQESKTVFSNIEITTTLHDYTNNLIMPSTLNPHLLPLRNWTYNEHTHDNHVHINMFLNNNMDNVVTFGVYSKKNNASDVSFNAINYFVTLLMSLLLMKL
ncbi:vanin-like protein 1 isoform X2 [Linepithema humile]|nr:PREDICTED: vanin-like protein 1 isoform X2 [Linepithema humile]